MLNDSQKCALIYLYYIHVQRNHRKIGKKYIILNFCALYKSSASGLWFINSKLFLLLILLLTYLNYR